MTTSKDIRYLSYIGKMGGLRIDKRTIEYAEILERIETLENNILIPYYEREWKFSNKFVLRFKDVDILFKPCLN